MNAHEWSLRIVELAHREHSALADLLLALADFDGQAVYRVPGDQVASVVGRLLSSLPVTDLTVEEPPLEDVMKELFAGSRGAAP
jgi:ABC-2 type transport system ATP-binding protein